MALSRRRTSSCCRESVNKGVRGANAASRISAGVTYLELIDQHGNGVELIVCVWRVSHGDVR